MHVMDQAITVKIYEQGKTAIIGSLVYVNCLKRLRRTLWDHLTLMGQHTNSPWIITGDFNIIANILKKTGDRDSYILAIQEFQNFISHNGLLDAGYKGPQFIWCNNLRARERIWERLDIVLYNLNFSGRVSNMQHHSFASGLLWSYSSGY